MTADDIQVGMHSETAFGPLIFEGNQLSNSNSISSLSLVTAQARLKNPCLPNEVARAWLDENKYHDYTSCFHEKGFRTTKPRRSIPRPDYLERSRRDCVWSEGKISIGPTKASETRFCKWSNWRGKKFKKCFSGKSQSDSFPTTTLQVAQIRSFPIICSTVSQSKKCLLNSGTFSIRHQGMHALVCNLGQTTTVFALLVVLSMSTSVEASKLCRKNSTLQSPFLRQQQKTLSSSVRSLPQKQGLSGARLWKQGLIYCIENGYDWIHHPFPVHVESNHMVHSSSSATALTHFKQVSQKSLAEFHF